jgi:hypothetical protein
MEFSISPTVCWALLLAGASLSHADDSQIPGRLPPLVVHNIPLGVYVHVDVEDEINIFQKQSPGKTPLPEAVLRSDLRQLEATMLANPAVSGITLGEHWDHIQTSPPDAFDPDAGYDWGYLDDAFAEAAAAHKSVQLTIVPGFNSPSWLIGPAAPGLVPKIPSCDPLFNANGTLGTPLPGCGTVTFSGAFPEAIRADTSILPLPWNSVYQQDWDNFLRRLSARYHFIPEFASIAVAGPIGASTEMIIPTSLNTTPAIQPLSGMAVDDMWAALIMNSFPNTPAYWNSDQAFIDSWAQAINAYEAIFSGITLFLGPDGGKDMPLLTLPSGDAQNPVYLAGECQNDNGQLTSCETKTEVLSYFLAATSPLPFSWLFSPPNGKATQVGGLTATTTTTPGDIGIVCVKLLTCEDPKGCPSLKTPPSPPFRGGAEFDHAVSDPGFLQAEGCPIFSQTQTCTATTGYPNLTPELGTYYVLRVFFDGTPAGSNYGGTKGAAPIHYLGVTVPDVQYAMMTPCATPSSPALSGNPSMQDLLNQASHDLFVIADPAQVQPLPPPTCILGYPH